MVIVLLVLLSILSACEKETATEEITTIHYVNFKVYDPVYVAIDREMCQQYGINIEIVGDVLAGPTGIQAVAGGVAEAALSSIPAIVNANAGGLPVIGVSDIQSAVPNQPLEYYYSLESSEYDSVEDLAGATWAVNLWRSSFHYTALMALEQAGIPEDQVEFVLLAFADQLAALQNGEVDIIGLMEPYNGQAKALMGDQLHLVTDAEQIFGQKQFTLHFFNRIWAREHPEAVTAWVSCIRDAINWIEANQDLAKPIIAEYTGIDAAYVPDYYFQEDGQVIMEDVQFWLDYLIARGDVTATWLNVDDIATNDYNTALQPDE
jgi:ABC-type nitrate/sulfonate/bicarbonate transport system substrate-binding protein